MIANRRLGGSTECSRRPLSGVGSLPISSVIGGRYFLLNKFGIVAIKN